MKLKSIVFVMSCLLVLGVSTNVFAEDDGPEAAVNANVDIESASVVLSNYDPGPTAETANLGIVIKGDNPPNHLPALILFDFDADNDELTGGGSVVTGIPSASCGGGTCKERIGKCVKPPASVGNACASNGDCDVTPDDGECQGGFDFTVSLILRNQRDDPPAAFSNCSGCSGGNVQCTTKGTATNCDEGICYQLGTTCDTGPDCWVVDNRCKNCTPDEFSYPMDVLCDDAGDPPCDRGYTKGEYQVGFDQNGQVMNGNTMVKSTFDVLDPASGTTICFEIPWALIVEEAHERIFDEGNPDYVPFNLATALANPPRVQVTALYDENNDGDDFTTTPIFSIAATDWIPDNGTRAFVAETNTNDPCLYNQDGLYGDPDVDGFDLTGFLNEFGRGGYDRPCPNCTPPQ